MKIVKTMRRTIRAGCGLIGLLGLLLLVCTGCGASSEALAGGETITPDQLQEISAAIFSVSEEPSSTADAETDDLLAAWEDEVYWLSGGTVVHTDRDCYHIRSKDGVQSGSTQAAASAGKTNLCSVCRKKTQQTAATATTGTSETEAAPQTDTQTDTQADSQTSAETASQTIADTTETAEAPTDPAEEVYWLASGKVMHTDRDCYHIRGKDGIQIGSVQAAANAGKTELCDACRKRSEQAMEKASESATELENIAS